MAQWVRVLANKFSSQNPHMHTPARMLAHANIYVSISVNLLVEKNQKYSNRRLENDPFASFVNKGELSVDLRWMQSVLYLILLEVVNNDP